MISSWTSSVLVLLVSFSRFNWFVEKFTVLCERGAVYLVYAIDLFSGSVLFQNFDINYTKQSECARRHSENAVCVAAECDLNVSLPLILQYNFSRLFGLFKNKLNRIWISISKTKQKNEISACVDRIDHHFTRESHEMHEREREIERAEFLLLFFSQPPERFCDREIESCARAQTTKITKITNSDYVYLFRILKIIARRNTLARSPIAH